MNSIKTFKVVLCVIMSYSVVGRAENAYAQSFTLPKKECNSNYCSYVYEQVLNGKYDTMRTSSGSREEKNECYQADIIVGKKIGKASYYIDQQDELFGGKMPHEKANDIRYLIFHETYEIRNKIKQLIYYGDVPKCYAARDSALKIIDHIMANSK